MNATTGSRRAVRAGALCLPFIAAGPVGTAAARGEFPPEWYYPQAAAPALRAMEGKPAPDLEVDWIGPPVDFRGRIAVIDFWGTWCRPCVDSIPKNNALFRKYADKGVVFIAVHDSSKGKERIPEIVRQYDVRYPLAVDQSRISEKTWNVSFWPTYAVLDREGVVRAIGLAPEHVEKVVARLAGDDGPAPAPVPPEADVACLEGTPEKRSRLGELVAMESPPPLAAADWVNSAPLRLEDLKGKVVLLYFWVPGRPACIRGLKSSIELHRKHAERGLAVIAVSRLAARTGSAELAGRLEIPYALCTDQAFQTTKAYRVDDYPDYFLIDRAGKLRVADAREECVEKLVESLLAEPAPAPAEPPAAPGAGTPKPQPSKGGG